MAIKKYPIIKYHQNKQDYISLVLPFHIIDKTSEVLVYGVNTDGYQRNPNKTHYNKIKKDAIAADFILPTSIILGVDKESIKTIIESGTTGYDYINIDDSKTQFRIVDGQHRIYGLREAAKENTELLNFQMNVIIVLSEENKRSVELRVFTDINSKAKRINTDLAELAKHDYQIKEKEIKNGEINMHIGIKTAYFLKSKNDNNVWQNAIKFDIHSEISLGIIGVKIFSDSISEIISKHLADIPYKENIVGDELIEYCNNASEVIGLFIYRVWNDVVRIKWEGAFKEDIVKNDEGELAKIFYNKDYYIQKGLGIKSINPIIGEQVKQFGINDETFDKIQRLLFNSKVKIDDWKNGGPLSGFNSESGFNKIKQIIKNELVIPQG